ncbi:MAG: cation diffusion facilitator family transporter [Hyphomonadaceae bacterium]|nr:cation diffusion facilitator family transporter [Hyphomonadaceae bacterium]
MHGHAHGAHDHHHDHSHHHHAPPPTDKRYSIAIALNLGFVILEAAAGFFANSTALLSDAAHNLSDVLGLALAGGAVWLSKQKSGTQRTYGYAKATVLAALANALVLIAACGGILFEALRRFAEPEPTQGLLVMAVAGAGVLVNGFTAFMFMAGRERDVNVRGAYLHMLSDAAVSAAVIVAGALIYFTNIIWIDPLVSVAVVALIAWGTWGLLRESLDLTLDTAPPHIDVAAVRAELQSQPGVIAVHDLHVWAMGATEIALTAHVVRPQSGDDAFLAQAAHAIEHRFGIEHVTLQVETAQRDDCAECD